MDLLIQHPVSRAIALGTLLASFCVIATVSCAHPATDRVLEPVGGPDASPSSPSSPATPIGDSGADPIAPVVRGVEPQHDYTAIRAPEVGAAR